MVDQITVTINNNSYISKLPNTGQLIDIKNREYSLSHGNMKGLLTSGILEDGERALDIKAVSHMSILFPDLLKDLRCNSLLDLRYDVFQVVRNVYLKEVFPWLEDFRKEINQNLTEALSKSEDDNTRKDS